MKLPGLDLPLGTIWCVGRNYAEHAKELGNAPPPSPIIFLKPASSPLAPGDAIEAVLGDGASRLSVTVARPA